jgi:hypothetical protein
MGKDRPGGLDTRVVKAVVHVNGGILNLTKRHKFFSNQKIFSAIEYLNNYVNVILSKDIITARLFLSPIFSF